MKRTFTFLFTAAMLLALPGCAGSTDTASTSAENAPAITVSDGTHEDAVTAVANMHIGWNLGDTLDVCAADRDGDGRIDEHPEDGESVDETLWGNVMTTPEIFAAWKAEGINAVRIPVTWRDHLGDAPDYTVDPDWMARVHEVVDMALAEDMYVLLNVHHDGGGDPQFGAWIRDAARDYPGTAEKYVTLWKQIAASFQDYPDKLIFESMNEVGFDNMALPKAYQTLNDLNQLFVKTVRNTGGNNPTRNLLIAGYWTDVEMTCSDMYEMPEDTAENALILSVHYYTPWEFCTTNIKQDWGVPGEVRVMQGYVNELKEHFVDNGYPVIVGEYGTGTGHDTASRVFFAENLTKMCHDAGIACYYWDNGGEFDRVNLYWHTPGLMEALQRAVSGEDYEVMKAD